MTFWGHLAAYLILMTRVSWRGSFFFRLEIMNSVPLGSQHSAQLACPMSLSRND